MICKHPIQIFFALLLTLASAIGCSQDEGKGGRALLTGKVFVRDFNSSGILKDEFYGPEVRVYLIYGNDAIYGDDMDTHYDGSYRFEYLQPGNYTIFAYSQCDTCAGGTKPVFLDTLITDSKQIVVMPDLVIND